MRRLSIQERQFLVMLRNAGGSYVFEPDDKVTSETHRMLRSLDRRGHIAMFKVEGWSRYRCDLTALGKQEAEHADPS